MKSTLNFTKKFLAVFLIFTLITHFSANAKTYYVSNSGNDNNDGLSTTSPWKTIVKVSSFKSFAAGDQILFSRGETFYGTLTINNSGTSGNPVTFGAYGSGAKPIITGFTTVSSWTNLGGNIWESSSPVSSLATVNMVTVNGVNTAMGRYPNSPTGYLPVQSHNGTTSVTNSSLTGTPNWTGATIVIRTQHWTLDTGTVKSQSGSTLTYSGGVYTPVDGFGFFVQNHVGTLDVQNEWYYNPSTKKIRIYSTSTPSNVEVANLDNLAYVGAHNYISFDNISFTGANSSLIMFSSCNSGKVTNCDFTFAVSEGIRIDNGSLNTDIENNTFSDCNSSAIGAYDLANSNTIIKYNTITRVGLIPGQTKQNTVSYGALHINGTNSLIQYNRLDSSGYAGIVFRGTNSKVINNFVTNCAIIKDDVGGIYTSGTETGKVIDGNIVLNTIGNANGAGDGQPLAYGIYLDDNSQYVTVTNNSISSSTNAGLFLHTTNNITVKNNTIYDSRGIGFARGSLMIESDVAGAARNNLIKNNIFFAKDASQYCFFNYNIVSQADAKLYGTSDSNYYARPLDNSNIIRMFAGGTTVYYTIAGWNTFTGQDAHSFPSPKAVNSTDSLRFYYNAGSSPLTISLPKNYEDVKGKQFNGTITLDPYSSAVLIQNGPIKGGVQSPTVNAGSDQSITNSATNLTATATPATGHTVTYLWTKVSGGADSITSSKSASTGITGLTTGTYIYRCSVTQDDAKTASDDVQINVNISGPPAIQENLINYSEDLTNSVWVHGSSISIIPNDIVDPLGNLTANRITTTTGVDHLYQSITVSPNTTYTFSFYAKKGTIGIANYNIQVDNTDGASLTTKVDYSSQMNTSTWTRVKVTFTTNATTTNVLLLPKNDGSSAGTLWIWGVQLNRGASAANYIKTPVSTLLPAVNPPNTVNGLDYKYYEGTGYTVLPNFSSVTPVKTGTASTFDISLANRSTVYSFNFTGYINVPADGQYIFYTKSDDGSNLLIDNIPVVNNDGVHGPLEISGTIGLKAGKHAISVGYFNQLGFMILSVSYAGPGITKQTIPASALYRSTSGISSTFAQLDPVISNAEQNPGVAVYPNPFTSYFEINIKGAIAGQFKLVLLDAAGKTVWNRSVNNSTATYHELVNTSAFSRGIYFLKLIQDNNSSVIKLVK